MEGKPMTAAGDRARRDAQALRDRLKAEGRHFDAGIVTRLIATSKGTATTNEVLYRDNVELRAQLEGRS